jgi:hypothetical protein
MVPIAIRWKNDARVDAVIVKPVSPSAANMPPDIESTATRASLAENGHPCRRDRERRKRERYRKGAICWHKLLRKLYKSINAISVESAI